MIGSFFAFLFSCGLRGFPTLRAYVDRQPTTSESKISDTAIMCIGYRRTSGRGQMQQKFSVRSCRTGLYHINDPVSGEEGYLFPCRRWGMVRASHASVRRPQFPPLVVTLPMFQFRTTQYELYSKAKIAVPSTQRAMSDQTRSRLQELCNRTSNR